MTKQAISIDQGRRLEIAVNHAIEKYRVSLYFNSQMSSQRMALAMQGIGHGLDTKRPLAWLEYGFPIRITNQMFYYLYKRGGIASGAVDTRVGRCWSSNPWLIQGDIDEESSATKPWERQISRQFAKLRLWNVYREADLRRLVCRYSGILLHVADGQDWDKPVNAGSSLVKLTPVWADALQPSKWIDDPNDENYGTVGMWTYTESTFGSFTGGSKQIHPDRVFILGDIDPESKGYLEPAYNALVSLEKIEGGSGESFLKNAARQIAVSYDKEVDLKDTAAMYGVPLPKLQDEFNKTARRLNRGLDSMLVAQGGEISTLVASVPDPEPSYNANLQTAASGLRIPTKILVGMQQGERASTEDEKQLNATCQSWRLDTSFEIEDFVGHLSELRLIQPVPGELFTVVWDDLRESSPAEKMALAKQMSEINSTMAPWDSRLQFTRSEIRVAAGYEPESAEDEFIDGDDVEGEVE